MITVTVWPPRRSREVWFFRRSIVAFLFLLWGTASAGAQNISVQGADWGYLTTVPPAWVQDRRSLYNQGIEGLFLPQGKAYDLGIPRILVIPPNGKYTFTSLPEALPALSVETASFQTVNLYSQREGDASENKGYSLYGSLKTGTGAFTFLLLAPSQEMVDASKDALIHIIENFVLLEKN